MPYTITQSQLPLVGGLAGHNLLVFKDPNGNVIKEFDGLATSADGRIKPIGFLPSDTLKVYEFNTQTYYKPTEHQTVVFSGTLEDINMRIGAAEQCATQMNSMNLSYPFLGLGKNSNSVASTLMSCIGVPEFSIPGGALIMPGVGDMLLSSDAINAIRALNGVNTSYVDGANTGTTYDNSFSTPSYPDMFGNYMFGPLGACAGFCCFAKGTKIRTSDGAAMRIEDVVAGTAVQAAQRSNTVLDCIVCVVKPGDFVYTVNGELECTWEQLLLAEDGTWLAVELVGYRTYRAWKREENPEFGLPDHAVRQARIGDLIMQAEGVVAIDSITRREVTKAEEMYSFVLDGNRTFIANDYVVESRVCADCFDFSAETL